jgi:TolA-binding protein
VTVIDFHPEDLLEREQAGTLSETERRRLAEHLAHCTSCRIERQLRADFEQELGVQTAPDMLQALVSGALRAAGASQPSPEPRAVIHRSSRAARFRRPLAVVIAAGVALGTALAAAQPNLAARALDFARQQVSWLLGGDSGQKPSLRSDADRMPLPRDEAAKTPGASEPVQPVTVPDTPMLPTLAAPLPASPAASHEPAGRRLTRDSATGASQTRSPVSLEPRARPARATATPSDAASPGVEAGESAVLDGALASRATSTESVQPLAATRDVAAAAAAATRAGATEDAAPRLGPALLFDRANAARSGGSGAEALYEELQTRFPGSAEAQLSLAILGRMNLDAGDAAAAIVNFEAYLSTGDHALREQAMAGCALAWAQLGRADRERQSWRALLAAYPDSSYARLARQRLARKAP